MSATMKRPAMTAEDATSFHGPSLASITQVFQAIEDRREEGIHPSCMCEPYVDTFTFHRWKAQGFMVRKGEKSLRIGTWVERGGKKKDLPEDIDDHEKERISGIRLRPQTVCLFCRCQVDRMEETR